MSNLIKLSAILAIVTVFFVSCKKSTPSGLTPVATDCRIIQVDDTSLFSNGAIHYFISYDSSGKISAVNSTTFASSTANISRTFVRTGNMTVIHNVYPVGVVNDTVFLTAANMVDSAIFWDQYMSNRNSEKYIYNAANQVTAMSEQYSSGYVDSLFYYWTNGDMLAIKDGTFGYRSSYDTFSVQNTPVKNIDLYTVDQLLKYGATFYKNTHQMSLASYSQLYYSYDQNGNVASIGIPHTRYITYHYSCK